MIGKRIKDIREKRGLSQKKLAEQSGVGYTIITRLEQGVIKEPTIQTVTKIADVLNISIDKLVGRNGK